MVSMRSLAGLADIAWRVVDAPLIGARLAHDAELGRQGDARVPALEKPADQLFVMAVAICVGGVEKIDAEIECGRERIERLTIVMRAIELGHAHAAESDGRDIAA